MNTYLIIILILLVADYLIDLVVDRLNVRHADPQIPEAFLEVYDGEKYAKSQEYLRENTRFDMIQSSLMLPLTIGFILLGGFRWLDDLARSAGGGLIGTGLLFAGLLILLSQLVSLPFSIYSTFVIEEKYGFNRTQPGTFVGDMVKGLLLSAVLGAPLLAGILWFFDRSALAWLYSWGALTVFQVILLYLAPAFIMPLFNKFIPLEEGELKTAIEDYAEREGFQLQGIFTMDGSKRSSKSNAYFTGFGRWRRIVLYDTLVEQHSTEELVAVLAHEVGHFRLRHIRKMLLTGVITTGLMFYILSLFISREGLYQAFKVNFEHNPGQVAIYAGLVFFGFLYTPISMLLGIFQSAMSRKHEYEADAFAARTAAGGAPALVSALKRLSVENLSNLTPHPWMVFMHYSHPPVLQRIEALEKLGEDG